MKIAVYPGSFDPVTTGHKDIIMRASRIFDHVVVLILQNSKKQAMFSQEKRQFFLQKVIRPLNNVSAASYDGLLVSYLKMHEISFVVKGVRNATDFTYEFQMAMTNQFLDEKVETVFLPSRIDQIPVSSSLIREIQHFGGNIEKFIPQEIVKEVCEEMSKIKEEH